MLSSVFKWVMIAVIWTVALAVCASKPTLLPVEQAQGNRRRQKNRPRKNPGVRQAGKGGRG